MTQLITKELSRPGIILALALKPQGYSRKHGLNPEQYAFWCYDEWPDVWDEEVITEESTDPDTGEKIYSQYKTGNMILVKKQEDDTEFAMMNQPCLY